MNEVFESFIKDYQDMVYTTAVRLLGDKAQAEDVSQEVFLKAYEFYGELKDSPTAGGWLKTVATNMCLNHLSRYRARLRFLDEPGLDALAGAREDREPETKDLEAALEGLPEAQRVPLVLFHFEDMSYEDIARKLGVSVGKIKTDIFRARQALRKVLDAR